MEEIEKLTFMQAHINPKIMSSINLNNAKYRRLSVPNSNLLFVPQETIYKPLVKSIHDTTFEGKENNSTIYVK